MLLLTSWDNEDKIDFIVHKLHDLLPWFINKNDDIDGSDDESKLFDEKNCGMFDGVVLTGVVCDTSLLILPKVGNEAIADDIGRCDNVFRCGNDNDSIGDDDTDDKKNNFWDDVM